MLFFYNQLTYIFVGRLITGRQVRMKASQSYNRPDGHEADKSRHQTEGSFAYHIDELLFFFVFGH